MLCSHFPSEPALLRLSVCILEEVHIGWKGDELSPTFNWYSHLSEITEVVNCNCALGWYTIRRLATERNDEILCGIFGLSK